MTFEQKIKEILHTCGVRVHMCVFGVCVALDGCTTTHNTVCKALQLNTKINE